MIEIFPAIDIIDGACVRLTKGDYRKKVKYFDDPLKVASSWKEKGARWLHIIDLDGAETGIPRNLGMAKEIKAQTGLKIQFGGGVRDCATLEKVLESGIDRAILGTRLIRDPSFLEEVSKMFPESFIPSIDYGSGGRVYVKGWKEQTGFYVTEFLKTLYEKGISKAIITDISRDGTLAGIDLGSLKKIVEKTMTSLIIAGGISSVKDIEILGRMAGQRAVGVILGKSLYEKNIRLEEAIKAGERA